MGFDSFGEHWVSLISTSNDDQPIQVQTAACCHCSIHLLSSADLIDTPTEQIETTLKRANKICQYLRMTETWPVSYGTTSGTNLGSYRKQEHRL